MDRGGGGVESNDDDGNELGEEVEYDDDDGVVVVSDDDCVDWWWVIVETYCLCLLIFARSALFRIVQEIYSFQDSSNPLYILTIVSNYGQYIIQAWTEEKSKSGELMLG